MKEIKHILNVLRQTKKAVKENDSIRLKELSNQTIHSASVYQDMQSILIAIIIYSLSKILERRYYQKLPGWNIFFNSYMKDIDRAIIFLEKDNVKKFELTLKDIIKTISRLKGDLKENIKDVFKKARINKASKIYEHGLSLEKTAKLLGISMWELSEYAGQKRIHDINLNITMPEKERIKLALNFLK